MCRSADSTGPGTGSGSGTGQNPSSNGTIAIVAADLAGFAGQRIGSMSVRIIDASGATKKQSGISITVKLKPIAGLTGNLGGTLTRTTVDGIATFDDLTISAPGDGYVIVASADGFSEASSGSVRVQAPPITVDSVTMQLLSDSADLANGNLIFRTAGNVALASPGTVLIGHQHGGFIKRVVSSERSGATLRYQTIPASINDVIGNDSVKVGLELPKPNGQYQAAVWGAIPENPPHFVPAIGQIECSGSHCVINDRVLFGSLDAGIVLKTASVDLDLRPEFVAHWSAFRPADVTLDVNGTVSFDGTVEVGLDLNFQRSGSILLGELVFPWTSGVVSGVFYVPVTLEWTASAEGRAKAQLNWKSTGTLGVGASWGKDIGWSPITSASYSFAPDIPVPQVEASATARLGLQLKPRLVIMGTLGADLSLQPFASGFVATDFVKNVYTTGCSTAVLMGVGVDASILGVQLARYEKSTTLLERGYASCEKSGAIVQINSPASSAPQITAVTPNPVKGSSEGQTVQIIGSNFSPTSAVILRDVTHNVTPPLQLAFISSSTLAVFANFGGIASSWTAEVMNADGKSSGQFALTVQDAPAPLSPKITYVDPNPIQASGAMQDLSIFGTNFVWPLTVRFRNLSTQQQILDSEPTIIDATKLRAKANLGTQGSAWTVEIIGSQGVSGETNLIVKDANVSSVTPSIVSLTPNPVLAAGTPQAFTITGNNFVAGATVRVRRVGSSEAPIDRSPAAISSTQISVGFTISVPGSWILEVINPSGQTSPQFAFTVQQGTTELPTSLPAPTPLLPGATVGPGPTANTLTPTFTWSTVNGASGYGLYIRDLTAPGQNLVFPNTGGTTSTPIVGASFTLPSGYLVSGHSYRWAVTTFNGPAESASQSPVLYFTTPSAAPIASPSISSVSPTSYPSSNSNQTMTINGSNFQNGATLTFVAANGGTIQSTASKLTFINSSQLSYQFNNQSDAGTWTVKVNNPDGQSSGAQSFVVTVLVQAPSISAVSPSSPTATGSSQAFTITGSGFLSGANVTLRDLTTGETFPNRPITSLSNTQIVLSTNFGTATTAHSWSVQVTNTDNQSSTQFNFTVQATPVVVPAPSIAGVNPPSPIATGAAQTFTITGSGFTSGANVTLRDITTGDTFPNRPISSLSSTQIVLSTNFGTATTSHSWSVQVTNTDNQSSNQFNFTVQATPVVTPGPSISGVSPSSPVATGVSQTFTINGSGFLSGANVTLRDLTTGEVFANRPISSLSSSQIVLSTNFGTASTSHSWSVQVTNTDNQSSSQFTFTVQPTPVVTPAPLISGVNPSSPVATGAAQTFTINGSGFLTGANVTLRDLTTGEVFPNRPVASLASAQIVLSTNFGTASTSHSWSAQVTNSDGQSSNQFNFTVQATPVVVPAPAISGVNPPSPIATGAAQTFTITGSGFLNGANVTLRDLTTGEVFSNRPIVSLSSTQIALSTNFGSASTSHSWSVQVTNPDNQSSNQFNFTVQATPVVTPAPSISGVNPPSPVATGAAQTFTISGSNFLSGANVTLRDLTTGEVFASRPVSSLSSTQIVLNTNFGTATTSHSWSVQVTNTDNQSSSQFNFTVQPTPVVTPAPSISGVNPPSPVATGAAQPFTISGANFLGGANVTLRDLTTGEVFTNRPISSLSSTQIVLSTNFGTATTPHSWTVQVTNTDNQSSSQFNFTVQATPVVNPAPTISGVNPPSPVATGAAQTFTVSGSGFLSGANVTLRDITAGQVFSNRPISSLSSTQIILSTNFGTATTSHSWSVQVTNTDNQSSSQFNFTVQATPVVLPAPTLSGLSPTSYPASNSNQTMLVNGSNFQNGATLTFVAASGGTIQSTSSKLTYVSTSQLSYQFNNAGDAGNWTVKVNNPDGQSSSAVGFTVQAAAPAPSIAAISPSSPVATGGAQNFSIGGSGFVTGVNVTLRDITTGEVFANRTVVSLTSSQVNLSINFGTATSSHSWSVQAINPDGQASNVFNFTVQPTPANAPTISGVSPSSPVATGSAQTFTISGSNFASGANVTLRDVTTGEVFQNRPITSLTASQIVLSTNFGTATSAHSWSVQVINTDGQSSNAFSFTVQSTPAAAPTITSVSPSSPIATGSSQTFTINGTNFATGANVTLRDITTGEVFANRTISSLSASQITLSTNFGTATSSHSWSVQITNTNGQASNVFNFTVQATPVAAPSIASVSPASPIATGSAQSFTISGSGFVTGANVTLKDITAGQTFANRTISSLTSTQIVINPNFGTATTSHSWSVQIINSNGQASNVFNFTVRAP